MIITSIIFFMKKFKKKSIENDFLKWKEGLWEILKKEYLLEDNKTKKEDYEKKISIYFHNIENNKEPKL